MQILFNELSLEGQFAGQDDFIKNAIRPFIGVLKEMEGFSAQLLKKSDAWDKMITPTCNLQSLLVASPVSDEVRRLKLSIVKLTREPFWDLDSKQHSDSLYFLDGIDIGGSSPAEACERDKIVISFGSSSASLDPLNILRNGTNVRLSNLTCPGKFTEILWANKEIPFKAYLQTRFSGGKIDFSCVDEKFDFSEIQEADQSLFIDTLRKFEELTWDQIYTDKGLNYKEYHATLGVAYQDIKTYKFRVSKKFRCHGFRKNDSFVILCFETDHKLSDRG